MRFRRRGNEIVIAASGDGIVVTGPPGAVDHIAAQLSALGGTVARQATAADAFAGAAALFGIAKTSGTYFQLSPASSALARQHGLTPTCSGFFSATFRDVAGKFVGNAEFAPASIGPEQALSIELLAVTLALRVAIANVEAAVERVEDKVELVATLLRAERIGDALGDRKVLEDLAARAETSGAITATDWSSIAWLGPRIMRDTEALRAHIRLRTTPDTKIGTRGRNAAARKLVDESLLRETLALLAVCEHNLGLWQELRIRNVAHTELAHLDAAVTQARDVLEQNRRDDQELLDSMVGFRATLVEPVGFEGLTPIQRTKLTATATELGELASWFAHERTLDALGPEDSPWPSPVDSARFVVRSGVNAATGAAQSAAQLIRRRDQADDPDATTGER